MALSLAILYLGGSVALAHWLRPRWSQIPRKHIPVLITWPLTLPALLLLSLILLVVCDFSPGREWKAR